MVAPPRGNGVPAKLSIGEPGHMPSTFAVAQMWRRYRIMVPIRATDDTTLYLHSDPYHPAGVAPGKRPRLTPNPALAIKGRDQFLPFGTPGGDVQSQAMLQVLLNLFVFGNDVQSAIEAPRFATYSFPSSFAPFDYYPGRLAVEGRIAEPVIAELARRGHEIQRWPDWIWTAGAVCAILADRRRGVLQAGADPRRAAYAIGW